MYNNTFLKMSFYIYYLRLLTTYWYIQNNMSYTLGVYNKIIQLWYVEFSIIILFFKFFDKFVNP
jgi:hypothetical protein